MQLHPRLAAILVFGSVLSGPAFGQVVTYTWSGTASISGNVSLGAAGNWVGGTAPLSNSSTTALTFGATSGPGYINVDTNLDVYSVTFSGSYPPYLFFSDFEVPKTLGIGGGGLSASTGNDVQFTNNIRLLANQTWSLVGGAAEVAVYGEISGAFSLTKTGSGTLVLAAPNSFSGGFDLQGGTLMVKADNAAGTGTLTLQSTTQLMGLFSAVTLNNPITLYSGVTFRTGSETPSLTLTGPVTLQAASTTVSLSNGPIFFNGAIGQTTAGSSMTFTGDGLAVLKGTNTYAGATTINGASVVFGSGSLAATSSVSVTNGGYASVAYNGGMTTLLGKISAPGSFTGTLGFDSPNLTRGDPITFADNLTLTSFDPTKLTGIGSFSDAILAGTITPVGSSSAADFRFGGGTGTLYVNSNLGNTTTGGVVVSSTDGLFDNRFSVFLRGTNTFTGGMSVTGANLIFDGASALPSGGANLTLGAHGYAGYTERTTTVGSFAAFNARIAASPPATGIIGIDTYNTFSGYRTVSDAIDLSSRGPVYLGTATGVVLSGAITPPTGGTLYLAGVNGGWLKATAALSSPTVSAVQIGYGFGGPLIAYNGIVELTSGSSNYTGNTTLDSGTLLLGASSTGSSGVVTNGPIGRGTLVVSLSSMGSTLAANASGVTLHNNISVASLLTIGAGPSGFSLTLNGAISGAGALEFTGNGDMSLTLGGANTFSGGFYGYLTDTIIANHNTAFGTGHVSFNGDYVQFNTSAPVIGGLSGGGGAISLVNPGTTLQINQQDEGWYYGQITGSGVTITKTGSETLHLGGNSTYTGTTNINAGKIVAEISSFFPIEGPISGPLGDSTVSLGGGQLELVNGVSIHNPITFSAPSRLTGSGTFSSSMTIGTNAILAPGASPGTMTFTNGLTFASGGTLEIEVQSAAGTGGAGVAYDTLSVTGTLAFTSTAGSPLQLNLLSLAGTGSPGAVSDFSSASSYSWQIASTTGGISGFTGSNVTINSAGFTNSLNNGFFTLSTSGTNLYLTFTPVPEPSTYALLLAGLGVIAWTTQRRRAGK